MRWLLALALASCIADPTVPCGELTCPAGFQCVAAGCARPADVAACANHNDGDLCETAGACLGGACHPIACGDGIVDQGEVCDLGAGNLTCSGCSLDCKSDETCGNGTTDICKGEQCDHGVPGLSGTGCSSVCTYEFEIWRDVTPRGVDSSLGIAAAYDSARGVTVIIGNDTDGVFTAEWDGTDAIRRHPRHSPPPMIRAPALAYDSQRERTVLFGGEDWSLAPLAETWEWDGLDWQQRMPATSPPGRFEAAMAYDPVAGRVVMFGGTAGQTLRDTWEWDGTSWIDRMPATPPKGRYGAGMAYDPVSHAVLLFGGVNTSETWEWASATGTWTQVPIVGTPPSPRSDFAMATDPRGNRIVLFGGDLGDVDTWAWDGTAWSQLATVAQPGASYSWLAMGTAPTRGPTVFVVATDVNGDVITPAQIWHLGVSDTRWLDVTPPVLPPTPAGNALAYDARRGRVVLFGGAPQGDTWEYDGDNWLRVSTSGPAARTNPGMVYDEARGVSLLFGGQDMSSPPNVLSDLWSWDGATWGSQAAGPPARTSFAMAYDAARGVTVVFGGSSGADGATWLWDGTSWTAVPLVSPGPDPAVPWTAVYDHANQRVVMVGGRDATAQPLMQTWAWNGSAWQLLCDPTAGCPAPSPRSSFMLAYDPVRKITVLFGGYNPRDGFMAYNDTWEWGSDHWYETPTLVSPPEWSNGASVYDAISRRMVLWGGNSVSAMWALSFEAVDHRSEPCAISTENGDGDLYAGCADPDCWGRCAPLCPPGEPCPMDAAHPYCGDGVCSAVEDRLICPQDGCP